MTTTPSRNKQTVEPAPIRTLTPAETQAVSGGPGGYPVLGTPVDSPRELTPVEARVVAGGPGGFPGLSTPLDPKTQASSG